MIFDKQCTRDKFNSRQCQRFLHVCTYQTGEMKASDNAKAAAKFSCEKKCRERVHLMSKLLI